MRKIIIILLLALITSVIQGQQLYNYLLKAKALTERGEANQSITLLSEAINRQPDYRFYLERASAYFVIRNWDLAIADLQAANELQSGSGLYGLAEAFALKGDQAASLRYLELHLGSTFKKEEKYILLDPAFSKIEETADWRLFWKTERYNTFETGLSEIEYYISIDDKEEAKTILNSLVAFNPETPGLKYAKALVAYSEKKFMEAINILMTVPELKMEEKSLRLLAKAQYGSENYIGSALIYTELINREILDAELFYLRADSYRKAGERDKALADLSRYLELYPDDGNALSLAGKTESETGDNIKALELFSRNIELHPSVASNYIDRANAYFSSASWKYAIDDYSMSLDLEPGNADVYLNKGIALVNSGKTEDACHDFRQSLKLGNKKASSYISRYCLE